MAWPSKRTCDCSSGSFSPAGDAELPFDQIETGDRFRHRMLDLEPRVHLDEPERVGAQPFGAVGDELDRAGADITDGARRLDGGGAHLRAQLRRHAGRRRFLDHLLVAPLQRAVALAEMNDIAMAVGEHLDFDVARRGNVFLDQDPARAERRFRLANGAFERRLEFGVLIDAAQPAAAAAGRRLDQHRIADLVGLLLEEFPVLPLAVIARHHRHAGLLHQGLGAILDPHGAHGRGRRPDKSNAGLVAGVDEVGVLGEKPVARMHAFGARFLRNIDDAFDREIAVARWRRTDAIRLVA